MTDSEVANAALELEPLVAELNATLDAESRRVGGSWAVGSPARLLLDSLPEMLSRPQPLEEGPEPGLGTALGLPEVVDQPTLRQHQTDLLCLRVELSERFRLISGDADIVRELEQRASTLITWASESLAGVLLDQLLDLAMRDFLTNLLNERAYRRDTEEEERLEGPVSVGQLDLDGLKQVNDAGTHEDGDQYIRQFVRNVTDRLPEEASFYRLHGDEFLILFRGVERAEAERILGSIQSEVDADTPFSWGVAEVVVGETLKDTERLADERMYTMKRARKGLPPE